MKRIFALGFVVALIGSTSLAAKGVPTRITLTDTDLGTSIGIVDPSVVSRFNVWDGRGTFSTVGDRMAESTEGFIIDWLGGAIPSRPGGLRRYEVKFYVRYPNAAAEQLAYVVFYERDSASREGFVYLPGQADAQYSLNVQAIQRGTGCEGHWFHASRAWQEAVGPLLPLR